jgi:protein SCO1/2
MRQWIFVILALAIAGATTVWFIESRTQGEPPPETGLLATPSPLGGPFNLIDQTGKPVTEKSWPGKYLLIYFGYTYCPDACPTELLVMGQALDQLGDAKSAKIQPIFISIDPSRDTAAKLAEYVPSFYPTLAGLTGSEAEVAAAAKAYKVYYAKSEASQTSSDYVIDHSSYVYLVNPQGQTIGIFSADTTAEDMAKALDQGVK